MKNIINDKVERFFSYENQRRIQGELQHLGYKYQEYMDYQINPYADNVPCSDEDEAYCYHPMLPKTEVPKPDEQAFYQAISKLFLPVEEVNLVWPNLSKERKKAFKNLAVHVVAKYQEVFGKKPGFISEMFL